MPSFLNPWFAAGAAAIVIPSLLLLYFLKLRRKEFVVSSTLLWRKAVQDLQVNAPFQRLRRNLLLILQLILLILLLLALSRPVMNYTPGAGSLAVIMIDRSASMSAADIDGRTRLDEAKRLAKELVDGLHKDAQAMVIAFDDSAEIVRSLTSDKAMLRQAIDSIATSDRRSRLKLAYQLAEAQAATGDALRPQMGAVKPEVWLYSDGRVLDQNELVLGNVDLKYTKVGTDRAANVGVVAMNAKRNYERPAEVNVFVRLANFGPEPVNAVAQLSIDGVVPPGGIRRDLTLIPERWTDVQREEAEKEQKLVSRPSADFTIPELMKGAVIRVDVLEQGTDLLAADNFAQAVVPPPRTLNVLLVSGKGNLWLEKFLESANLKNPGITTPADYEKQIQDPQAVAAKWDVIIFDRYQPAALPPAGNFIYFNAAPPESKLKVVMDGQQRSTLKEQTVLDWERGHPMLRGLNLRFYAPESLKLEVPLDAQVLVEGRQGALVVLQRQGRITHLLIAFDVQESTWPTSPSFPIFMDNALQFLALGSEMDVRQAYQPGATPRIPRYNLQQAGAGLSEVRISGPASFSSVAIPLPPTGDFALPSLDWAGIYTLSPAVPQFEKLAVNLLDESESNLLPVDQPPGGTGERVEATAGKSRLELWWWIAAFAALPLLLIEWWVYTRRVHI